MGGVIVDSADEVLPHDVTTDSPSVTYRKDGREHRVTADFVVGCDGYHGVCRTVIPPDRITTYEKDYPFGWLGVLAEVPPLHDLVYCNSPRLRPGFAAQCQPEPVLRPMPARGHDRRLAG